MPYEIPAAFVSRLVALLSMLGHAVMRASFEWAQNHLRFMNFFLKIVTPCLRLFKSARERTWTTGHNVSYGQ